MLTTGESSWRLYHCVHDTFLINSLWDWKFSKSKVESRNYKAAINMVGNIAQISKLKFRERRWLVQGYSPTPSLTAVLHVGDRPPQRIGFSGRLASWRDQLIWGTSRRSESMRMEVGVFLPGSFPDSDPVSGSDSSSVQLWFLSGTPTSMMLILTISSPAFFSPVSGISFHCF